MMKLDITNIGGIRSGSASVEDGLNVIQASNFRGKSSFITALRTAIGATGQYEDHPLTEGMDTGKVTLETEGDEYNVMLERPSPGVVKRTGTPYLSDETDQICARLYACLDKNNPVRKAVRNGEDLTDLLQDPLNIEDIDAQINALKGEKREIKQKITEAKRAGDQLPSVQETVTRLKSELEELRSRREELADEGTNKERIEEISDEISTKSGKLTNISNDISRIERELERKRDQVSRKEGEINELNVPEELDQSKEVDAMRDQIDTIDRQIDLIEDLYRANQNVIDASEIDTITDVNRSIAADDIECWVCGQQTTIADVEEYIAQLQSKAAELRDEKSEIETELEEIEAREHKIRQARQKKEGLKREIQQLKSVIDEKKGILEEKRDRESSLKEEIKALQDELDAAEDEYNEELTDVKTEIRTTETKLQNVREDLESLEQKYGQLEEFEAERKEIQANINVLRNRKKTIQKNLKENFNAIIVDIIEELQPGFSSARLVLKTDERGEVESIDLEIARDLDSKGQRTSVDTLSEGEVELIGLVVALAGYHAFDVDNKVPCILIDGISQLAAEHLRTVATYLEDMSNILVTTAYPEAGNFEGNIINPDEWHVVSDETAPTP
jgi:DNA repair exonuclease SbcCD ATPase subunit